MEKILSLHIGHDATALFLDDEGILAISEERVTRIKNFHGFPFNAINEIFKIKKLNWNHITKLVITSKYLKTLKSYKLLSLFKGESEDYSNEVSFKKRRDYFKYFFKKKISFHEHLKIFLKKKLYYGKVIYLDHHLCHVASSYAMFPLKKCFFLSLDGGGDSKNWTLQNMKRGKFKCLEKNHNENNIIYDSPADIYSNTCKFLGFKRNQDEGKLMGLAATGNPKCKDYFDNLLKFENGQFYSKLGSQKSKNFLVKIYKLINFLLFGITYDKSQINDMKKKLKCFESRDIACSLQIWCEEIILKLLDFYKKKYNFKNFSLLLSGGFFANILVNKKIREQKLFKKILVTPNMGDGGLTLGGAFIVSNKVLKKKYFSKIKKNIFFGPEYRELDFSKSSKFKDFKIIKSNLNEISEVISDELVRNKIIGIFNYKMEFGPRALCSRSILANPKNLEMVSTLNKRLKRSEYMPFGPIIRDIDAQNFLKGFDSNDYSSLFMTTAYKTINSLQQIAPCVVHIDLTARPQVLNKKENQLCYKILSKFYSRTKIPVLINTSFNVHEEPIVMKPEDCIEPLKTRVIDTLVINNFIIKY